jgi:hypothetical protein
MMKSIYRHKTSGDVFAIETDERGCIVSSCGPLLSDKLDPRALDYDDYWNDELAAKLADFERISKDDYLELLRRNGFFPQITQRHLF